MSAGSLSSCGGRRVLEIGVEIPKRASAYFARENVLPTMIDPVVREPAVDRVPVAMACPVLEVSSSGYYEWDNRGRPQPPLPGAAPYEHHRRCPRRVLRHLRAVARARGTGARQQLQVSHGRLERLMK